MSAIAVTLLLVLGSSEEPPAGAKVKVEPRLLVKERRVFATAGPSYFLRGDYYDNPGLSLALSFYPGAHDGLDLKVSYFFSRLTPAGAEVFQRTGLVPDAPRQIALVTLGYRRTFGYGKVLVGPVTGRVIHFDLQANVNAGLALTDRGPSPVVTGGPALLVRFTPLWHIQLDGSVAAAVEKRQRVQVAMGLLPMLTVGAAL